MTISGDRAVMAVSALGSVIEIVLPDDAPSTVAERIRGAWVDAAVEGTDADHVVCAISTMDEDALLETLSVQVTLQALLHGRGSRLMFHAAGVADDDGRVLAFVGPSGRGKTTLSRALGGFFGYVSDESVSVDAERRVFPYRKPLSVVRPGAPKEQVAPSAAGMSPLPEAELRLSALVLLDRAAGRPDVQIESVEMADAIIELVPEMSYLAELDRPLQRLCTLIDGVGGVRRLLYSEAVDVPPVVASLMTRDTVSGEQNWRVATSAPLPVGVLDALDVGGELIVLAGSVVHLLGGIAPEIWVRRVEGSSVEEIVDAVIERYGPAPDGDAAELVAAALAQLQSARLLDVGEAD